MFLHWQSISRQLSRYVLLISASLLLITLILLGYFCRRVIIGITTTVAEKEGDLVVGNIDAMISEVELAVNNVDWFVQRGSQQEKFMYDATRELVMSNPGIIGSAVAFEPGYFRGRHWFAPYTYIDKQTGEMHTLQMGNADYDYPAMDWYRVPKLYDKPVWSEPYFDEGGGYRRMATYSLPLKDTTGTFLGIITSDISLEGLSRRLNDSKPSIWKSYAVLISSQGTYIVHPDSSKVLKHTIFDTVSQLSDTTALAIARDMVNGRQGSARFRGYKGEDYFGVYRPLTNGWSILLVNSYESVFYYLYIFNAILGVMTILGLVGLYIGCRRVIRRQTMPIVEFSQAAMTMAKGNFKARLPEVKQGEELQKLRDSLAYMQQSLNEYIAELKSTTASNERYESELTIARDIQMSMLPQNFPENHPDCDFYAMVNPAKEVGGDLYDFIYVGNRLFFLVGDVSGKGVPAALFMSITRSAFRFIGSLGLPINEVVSRVNDCLCDGNKSEMFVTLFAGSLDLSTGELNFCNAGHNPIVVVGPDGSASFLRAKPNLAAGLYERFPYEAEQVRLEHGSRLILYTDGVTEAERADKTQFGNQALLEWAGKLNPSVSAYASTLDLYARVRHFAGDTEQNDDITIVSILLK